MFLSVVSIRIKKEWHHVNLFTRVAVAGSKRSGCNVKFVPFIIKGCACYIFASLFFMSKREHFETKKNAFYFTLIEKLFFQSNYIINQQFNQSTHIIE